MHFDKPTYSVRKTRKKDIPKGLYTKDPISGDIVFNKEVEDNQMVAPKSGHHFPIGARARIAGLFDSETFVEADARRPGDWTAFRSFGSEHRTPSNGCSVFGCTLLR